MIFGLLGELLVIDDEGRERQVTAARQRSLLAALLLGENQIVSSDAIAELIWDGSPPQGAATTVRTYVTRLRKSLGPDVALRIRTREPGYLAKVGPQELDVAVLESLSVVVDGHVRAGDRWTEAVDAAVRALALWRDVPLVDVPSERLRTAWLPRLEERRNQLLEWRIEAELHLGAAAVLIPEIQALIAQQPYREPLYRLLMLSLARMDRNGEALEVYQQARSALVEGLGIEPGPTLRELHGALLRGEPEVRDRRARAGASARRPPADPASTVPRQLPADVRTFVGRSAEQAELTCVIEAALHAETCETVVISAIDGMGGVGKSALAVRVARRLSDRFPDGQLFVDFRSHTEGLTALTPEEALGHLLGALGVAPARMPASLAERTALYRSKLAGTRTLILIDNAATAAQARPLLPADPGCLAMVTSRGRLVGLDDAHFVSLDVLPPAEAVALLRQVAGPDHARERTEDLELLAELCGRLPLALRVAASYLRHRRTLSIAAYTAGLRDAADRLGLLQDEDRNLTAVFESSFRDLSAQEQRCLSLLGLIPGADFDTYAVANLLGDAGRREAERLLESLLTQSLLVQRTPGRYEFHDLVRLFARRRVDTRATESSTSWERLLDYYERCAGIGELRLDPTRPPRKRTRSRDAWTALAPELPGRAESLDWFRAELGNIKAAVLDARRRGRHERVVDLAASIEALMGFDGHWPEAVPIYQDAVDSAHELGRQELLAEQLAALGNAQSHVGLQAEASETLESAAKYGMAVGDKASEALALMRRGVVVNEMGEVDLAGALFTRALELRRELEDPRGEAAVLIQLGALRLRLGDVPAAAAIQHRALELNKQVGSRLGEAVSSWQLADLEQALGHFDSAVELLSRSLELMRELRHPSNEGYVLWLLGTVRFKQGAYEQARAHLDQAIHLFENRDPLTQCYIRWDLGKAWLASGEPVLAASIFQRCLALFRSAGVRTGIAEVLCDLGRVRAQLGAPKVALLHLEASLAIFREASIPYELSRALNARGSYEADHGDTARALKFHREALDSARRGSIALEEARALDGISRSLLLLGDRSRAEAELAAAVALYRRMGAAERDEAADRLAALRAAVA
jgi:DNA-binding SARP family transcriptional activator